MISFLEMHKRVLSLTCLLILLGIGAVTLLEHYIELSGGLFLTASFLLSLYIPTSSYVIRKKSEQFKINFYKYEAWVIASTIGSLLLLATFESFKNVIIFSFIFGELLIFLILFVYFNLFKNKRHLNNMTSGKSKSLPSWAYFIFFVVNAFLIVILEDTFVDKEQFGIAMLTFFIALLIFVLAWIFKQITTIIDLQQVQKTTELKHLQNQVNPHFFFNMLNNLYGWVEKDTQKAQEMILNLSDMMRYSIYDGQEEFVKIDQEVAYLKNYTDLHMSRYRKGIDVKFDVNIEDPAIKIKPLLLIILIENAFKHGVEKLRDHAFVHISLRVSQTSLLLTVENNFDPESMEENHGIGLQNLQRRLTLSYPNKFTLTSSKDENIYNAQLTLQLS